MNISAAMIIKRGDEAELKRCLSSIKPHVSQIVAVTSPLKEGQAEDETDRLLNEYGAQKILFAWTGDYSQARNESLKYVTGDYVLVIDTDEYIKNFDFRPEEGINIYRILRENEYREANMAMVNNERINRLFKNGLFHYEGKVHEQLVANDKSVCLTKNTDVTFGHTGYTDRDAMLQKSRTYRKLLQKMLDETPSDPYIYFQLGRTYYVEKDYENAISNFEKALSLDPDPELEYTELLLETYGYALLNHKEAQKAMAILSVYDDFSRFADYLFLCGHILMNNARFDEAVSEFEKAAGCERCSVEGVNSYLAYYNCGVIREVLGQKKEALSYYEKCGSYPPARDAIERCRLLADK